MQKQTGGFTLIELLVVVLIIGILAAVALPQYQKAVAKSRFTQLQTAAKSLKDAMEVYYMANGSYPYYWNQLDIEYPGCTESSSARYMLWCEKFSADMFGGDAPYLRFFDSPSQNKPDAENPRPTTINYIVWLDHSENPGKTECSSSIAGLCKSMGF